MTDYLDIDGSLMEGGGQILRISVSLSAIVAVPIRITNIRSGRKKPGLAAQHLTGIKLVADMCGAKLRGASIGSTEIEFAPSYRIRQGHYVADTHTAGSISLLLQVSLPCALFADGPVRLDLKGGTNADMAPQIDYFTNVFMKTLRRFGVEVNLKVHRRGYFPKGGGHVTVDVQPVCSLKSITLIERGELVKMYGWSFVAGTLPMKLAYQMSEGAEEPLRAVHRFVDIKTYKEDPHVAPDNCSGIIVACETSSGCVLGADGLGRRGAAARDVGRGAGDLLRGEWSSGACLDQHAQDQVIVYMALAEGKSLVRCGQLTLHTRTAIHFAEMISKVKFSVHADGEQNLIECTGIGHTNRHLAPI